MFPHATCLCVNAAQKRDRNIEVVEHQSQHHYQHLQENCDRIKYPPKQSKENAWIIQRHVGFVKINVLSPLQASSILQHQLCQRQVSHTHFKIYYMKV